MAPNALWACLTWVGAAQAQPAPPPDAAQALRQGETIQRQQQERIDQDTTRVLTSPTGPTVIDVPTHEKAVARPGTCQTITEIRFEHSPLMNEARRKALIAPYVGRCMGLGDVENLLSDITRFYIDKSRPTTRVYIKPQSLAQGVLVLDIVEGRVEKVEMQKGAEGTVNLGTAFGMVDNQTFNLRVFEQGLDQINRLASNHATLDIVPGSRPGYSIVRIVNHPTSRIHASASYDNTGQPSTGTHQGTVTLIADNLIGVNEVISYTRRQTIPADQPNAQSISNSIIMSVPWNALTFTGGYSSAIYRSQTVTSGGTVFVLNGRTESAFAKMDIAVWRNSRNKVELSFQLTNKRNRNFINDIYLPVSSRVLTTLEIDANWSVLVGNGTLKLGAGWVKGLNTLGALDDGTQALNGDVPRAQFDKVTARAYMAMPFQVGHQRLTWTAEAEGQYALVPLYSSEQIVLGSPFTVRGFLQGSMVADRGGYLQQDVSTMIPLHLGARHASGAGGGGLSMVLRPHVGFDMGYVASVAPGGLSGTVMGASAGLGLAAGPLNIDFNLNQSIMRGALPDEGLLAFLRATLSF